MMGRVSGMVVAALLITVAHLDACTPMARERSVDDWANDPKPSYIDGDLDAAEMRWRKEIEASRAGEDRLLTDDPAGAPSSYGKVAAPGGAEAADAADPPPPTTFWGRFKAGADTFGKASFAALTVIVTLGMMAAPYLIPAI